MFKLIRVKLKHTLSRWWNEGNKETGADTVDSGFVRVWQAGQGLTITLRTLPSL